MPIFKSSIDSLVAAVNNRGGLAKSNRFEFTCSLPFELRGLLRSNDLRDITVFCENVNFPGIQLETTDYDGAGNWQTSRRKIVYGYTHGENEITMQFQLTNDFFIHRCFKEWIDSVVNTGKYTSNLIAYEADYRGEADLSILDVNDKPIRNIHFYGIFPVTLGELELNSGTDDILKVQVTMAYEQCSYVDLGVAPIDTTENG